MEAGGSTAYQEILAFKAKPNLLRNLIFEACEVDMST